MAACLLRSFRSLRQHCPARGLAKLTGALPLHTTDHTHEDIDGLEDVLSINGEGKVAMVFGGFGMQPKQISKHEELYQQHGFRTIQVASSINELTTPALGPGRGKRMARELQERNEEVILHCISGSFWTAMYMLAELDPDFRENKIKAFVFDSCPPRADIYAFGGWLCYALKLHAPTWQPILSHLFHPYVLLKGINESFRKENQERMHSLVPKKAHVLFMHGQNDPVLNTAYLHEYVDFLRSRTEASCVELMFDRGRHSMAIVDHPELYKACHVNRLLALVPGWHDDHQAQS